MSPPPSRGRRQPELLINRELSWLQFNGRVLEEARDRSHPPLERLRFATIVSSNLDEFFMVRVAALKNAIEEGHTAPDQAGLTPVQQLEAIAGETRRMVASLYELLDGEIAPALAERGVRIVPVAELDADSRNLLVRHAESEILPALTPLAIDAARPFPLLAGLALNLAALFEPEQPGGAPRLGVVQVPPRFPRFLRIPGPSGATFALLEEVLGLCIGRLFTGQALRTSAVFRIARDSELDLDDEGGDDYLESVQEELLKRRRNRVVRLEVGAGADAALVAHLVERLEIEDRDVYCVPGMLDIRPLAQAFDLPILDDLREPLPRPLPLRELPEGADSFEVLDGRDVLLHHPYDAFDPVTAFLARAAADPDVLAIKQTLYRTSGDSPVVQALARAAESGKQVTAVVELRARFDEDSNIRWARSLEQSGAHVIYGFRGYKTHAKICLVVRRGPAGIRRYVHLGTGNYNDRTARLYTDFGLLTSDPAIGEDASAFFNALTGWSDPPRMKKLIMAPTRLRSRLLELIDRERRRAEEGQPAAIRAKMNSLVDEEVILALYEASKAGVTIRLNVRGICCLRPGMKGVSPTIQVVSIVDRFLEHSRVFEFHNGGDTAVFLSSADWMPRNLDRRIELLVPVEAPDARDRLRAALDVFFADNTKARVLQADGTWRQRKPGRGEEPVRAQRRLYEDARLAIERSRRAAPAVLEPLTAPDAG